MKEIIEALSSRIRSPLFGYFMLSFIVINWKIIFYLLASKKSADFRITYFSNNSDITTLLYMPLLFAVIGAIVYPYVNYLFLKISKHPTELKNSLQAHSEHALLTQKQKLEGARSSLLSTQESDLIERAKRDDELNKIEDEEVRNKLKSEIDTLRKKRDEIKNSTKEKLTSNPKTSSTVHPLNEDQLDILKLITKSTGAMFKKDIVKASAFDHVKTEYYLEDLVSRNYLYQKYRGTVQDYVYSLTTMSKKIMVEAGIAK